MLTNELFSNSGEKNPLPAIQVDSYERSFERGVLSHIVVRWCASSQIQNGKETLKGKGDQCIFGNHLKLVSGFIQQLNQHLPQNTALDTNRCKFYSGANEAFVFKSLKQFLPHPFPTSAIILAAVPSWPQTFVQAWSFCFALVPAFLNSQSYIVLLYSVRFNL